MNSWQFTNFVHIGGYSDFPSLYSHRNMRGGALLKIMPKNYAPIVKSLPARLLATPQLCKYIFACHVARRQRMGNVELFPVVGLATGTILGAADVC